MTGIFRAASVSASCHASAAPPQDDLSLKLSASARAPRIWLAVLRSKITGTFPVTAGIIASIGSSLRSSLPPLASILAFRSA
jgi:hypothetical protein